MSLASYADLCSSVASWLHRGDLTLITPDFVTLAEARIARDLRLRAQIATSIFGTTAGVQSADLPSDFLEAEDLICTGVDPVRPLHLMSTEQMNERFPFEQSTGSPYNYAIQGTTVVFGPTPDAVYALSMSYYARFPALSSAGTNWLLANHPGVYLFASLCEAAPYIANDARIQTWEAKYQAEKTALQQADDMARFSGGSMRVRSY